jgi:hypothetical protein
MAELLKYRKESKNEREAFLEYIIALQAKIGDVPVGEDYGRAVSRMIDTEVIPAARQYRSRLESIRDRLFGSVAKDAVKGVVGTAAGTAGLEIFGDLSWARLLSLAAIAAGAASIAFGKATIDALVDTRAAKRECALSYLLDLEP